MKRFRVIRSGKTGQFEEGVSTLIEGGYELLKATNTINRNDGQIEYIAYMIYNGSK